MRIRDDLELSVLAEFGDPALAEAAGLAFQTTYEVLCHLLGIDPEPLTDFEEHMMREHGL